MHTKLEQLKANKSPLLPSYQHTVNPDNTHTHTHPPTQFGYSRISKFINFINTGRQKTVFFLVVEVNDPQQGFSNYGSQPQMGSAKIILGSRKKLAF